VVFDKTGTLTEGKPELIRPQPNEIGGWTVEQLTQAAALAAASRHPLARALAAAAPGIAPPEGVREEPGRGMAAGTVRLGSRAWIGVADDSQAEGPELWLDVPGQAPIRFAFADAPRPDSGAVVAELKRRGLKLELLSGDREATVRRIADQLGIDTWQAARTPADKVARLEQLKAEGRKVLMVGDGLNDAPALAAAHVSASPSTAVDVSQTAADVVFQGHRLGPVAEVLRVAVSSRKLVKQNFVLALGYNVFTVPMAVAGFVTPLIAAIAMSTSSLVVIGNALRLSRGRTG
ncbi:MAG TPA: HAD-IC family P-type ATPase, partial [Magnetospirillum sp.]|nr:HAD-IC family P-type ATPase [Magnetospirillum sp.]